MFILLAQVTQVGIVTNINVILTVSRRWGLLIWVSGLDKITLTLALTFKRKGGVCIFFPEHTLINSSCTLSRDEWYIVRISLIRLKRYSNVEVEHQLSAFMCLSHPLLYYLKKYLYLQKVTTQSFQYVTVVYNYTPLNEMTRYLGLALRIKAARSLNW